MARDSVRDGVAGRREVRSATPTAGQSIGRASSGDLRVEGVSKQFPRMSLPALQNVDIQVGASKFLSLIGPSGCGKTTLLRIVAGLASSTSGRVLIDGQPSIGPTREKSLVFQHFNLFPWRTAIENTAYGLEMQGVSRKDRIDKAAYFLKLVGLDGFYDHYPSELSGGMRQRVGIARALAVEPKVMLMDEPFGALDALTRENLQIELEKICAATSLTVLFVTHSIDEAIFLSDEVVVMGTSPGRVIRRLQVDLTRPRWRYDARSHERFASLRSEIWSLLQEQMAGSLKATSAIGD